MATALAAAAAVAESLLPISVVDLDSLLPGRSFTDGIIDAFFSAIFPKLIQAEGLSQNLDRCMIFAPGLSRELHSLLLKPEEATPAFPGLEAWFESNNILGKDFLLLPLVDSTHASLLIVHRLAGQPAPGASAGIVGAAGGSGAGGKPCILHLDSLHVKGQGHRPNLGALRALLQRVAQQQQANPVELTEETLPAVAASVPQQGSACDGAAYMCTNMLYFVACLPPEVDPQEVARLEGYRLHLQDLFEGTAHCYPGLLTTNWYPKNVPVSLRKRLLQSLAELVQQQEGRESAEREALLHHMRTIDAQLRAISKRPFEMPASRRQKQEGIKASLRLQQVDAAKSSLISEGTIGAVFAARAAVGEPAVAGVKGPMAAPAAPAATSSAPKVAAAAPAATQAASPAPPAAATQTAARAPAGTQAAAAAPAGTATANQAGGAVLATVGTAAQGAPLASDDHQTGSSGRQLRARSSHRLRMLAGSRDGKEAMLASGSDTEADLPPSSDSDSEYRPAQHDVDHLVVPSWQRRPSGLSKERSAGQAAAWAASPRPRVASTMGHPSSVGQGVQLASSAGLSQAAAVAVQPVGAAAATARGLKRMSTGDLRGRLTLGGTEYYLGRFPTTLAAAQAEDFVALWKLGPATAESRNKLNLQLKQYDSNLVTAVCACEDFPAVKSLAHQRCGASSLNPPSAQFQGQPAALQIGSTAAEPAASSAGNSAGLRSQAQPPVPGVSSKRPVDGAPPGSEPPAKRQVTGTPGSLAGELYAVPGSAQPAVNIKQGLLADKMQELALQLQQGSLRAAVNHLADAEHAPEGQQHRKRMRAMILALQLLGLESEMWSEFIDLYAKLPTDRQRMKFAALQALLEQLGQEDTAPADASHVMTRWVAQQLSG